ncbi:hypothetical protein HOY80DRAFT_323423 [Tuber brumale]|nr:hypothetical protein HOY80DRAFT_323423 [Tuber brumale]
MGPPHLPMAPPATPFCLSPPYPLFSLKQKKPQRKFLATDPNGKTDTRDEMNPAAPQYPIVSINSNCGNVTDSHKDVWNSYNISVSDEKRQAPERLSPLASRERHQAVRDARADGVGDWLLRNQKFSTWRTLEDRATKPILLCYGDSGVGKTYIRYELP